jgi:hypothetical protein
MKIKIRTNRDTGEIIVNYYKVRDAHSFRYNLLKNVLSETKGNITLMVDTNQRIEDRTKEEIEAVLRDKNIKYVTYFTNSNDTKFFGINIEKLGKKKKNDSESVFLLDIVNENLTQGLFSDFLSSYDIAIGIDRNKDFNQICESGRFGIGEMLFKKEYFNDSIYDSVLCTTIRSTIDISEKAKETAE